MATIGSLSIQIEALTGKLDEQIKQSKGHFDKWRGSIDSVKNALVGLGALEVFRQIGGIIAEDEKTMALLKSQIKATGDASGQSAQQMADFADKLESSTTFDDDKIRETQAELTAFTNISGQQFNRTIKVILDFATVTGRDASEAVRTLGQAINDPISSMGRLTQAGISLDQATKTQIKSLQQHGDLVAAQNLLLSKLEQSYGGAAAAARNTFGGAIEGLKNSFSDLFKEDAPGEFQQTTDAINQLSATLEDPQIHEGIQAISSGIVNIVTVAAEGAEKLTELGKALGFVMAKSVDGGAGATSQLEYTQDLIASLTKQADQLKEALSMGDTQDFVNLSPEQARQKLAGIQNEINLAKKGAAYESAHGDDNNSSPMLPGLPAIKSFTAVTMPKLISSYGILGDVTQQFNDHLADQANKIQEASKYMDDLDPSRAVERQIKQIQSLVGTVVNGVTFTEKMANTEIQKITDQANQKMNTLSAFGTEAAKNMQDAFANLFLHPTQQGFKGLLLSFVQMVEQMVAQLASAKLLDSMFGSVQGANGNGSTGLASIISTGLSSIFGASGKKASGGPVAGGNTYLVGENGPELFTAPGGGGSIIPNHAALAMGGGTTHINIDARGAGPDEVAKLMQMGQSLRLLVRQDAEYRMQRGAWPSLAT